MSTSIAIQDAVARLLQNLGSEESRRIYQQGWDGYTTWLATQVVDVREARPRHIEGYLVHLRETEHARATCSRVLSIVRAVYGILVRDELMDANPAREVKTPKFDSNPKTKYLNEEQAKSIFQLTANTWQEKRDRLCIQLLLGLGWRRSEVARMCIEDIARKDGHATGIRKGDKRTAVGVPPVVLSKIEKWIAYANITNGALLPRSPENQRPISGGMIYHIVANTLKQAGLEGYSPHSLRRTFTSILHNRGESLRSLQIALSHNSITTTEKYSKAADALKNAPGQGLADILGED